jgi:hypothetical protein
MAFAGVSVIADGKLLAGSTPRTVDATASSGYHLLVIEGYSGFPPQQIMSQYSTDDAGFISLRLSNQDSGYPKAVVKAHAVRVQFRRRDGEAGPSSYP